MVTKQMLFFIASYTCMHFLVQILSLNLQTTVKIRTKTKSAIFLYNVMQYFVFKQRHHFHVHVVYQIQVTAYKIAVFHHHESKHYDYQICPQLPYKLFILRSTNLLPSLLSQIKAKGKRTVTVFLRHPTTTLVLEPRNYQHAYLKEAMP